MAFGRGAIRYVRTTRSGSQLPKRAHDRMTQIIPDARRNERNRIVFIPAAIFVKRALRDVNLCGRCKFCQRTSHNGSMNEDAFE